MCNARVVECSLHPNPKRCPHIPLQTPGPVAVAAIEYADSRTSVVIINGLAVPEN